MYRIAYQFVGDDAVLQLRSKLVNYATYPLIDLLDKPNPELQLLVIVNRLDAQSSKMFLSSFEKQMNAADVKANIYVMPQDKKPDPDLLSKGTPDKPRIFVTTPEMMENLRNQGIIKAKSVLAMVVYEAEYVLRMPSHVDIIRSALDKLENCQVILACHDGTEDVMRAAEAFDFREEAMIFSMDYVNVNTTDHFYVTENASVEVALDRAVQMSKENVVVLICHDTTEVIKMKERFSERTEVLTLAKAADTNVANGLLITTQVTTKNRLHGSVKMIVSLLRTAFPPDRYLEMLASYLDLGEQCEVVIKVSNQDALRNLEALGVSFKQYTAAEH